MFGNSNTSSYYNYMNTNNVQSNDFGSGSSYGDPYSNQQYFNNFPEGSSNYSSHDGDSIRGYNTSELSFSSNGHNYNDNYTFDNTPSSFNRNKYQNGSINTMNPTSVPSIQNSVYTQNSASGRRSSINSNAGVSYQHSSRNPMSYNDNLYNQNVNNSLYYQWNPDCNCDYSTELSPPLSYRQKQEQQSFLNSNSYAMQRSDPVSTSSDMYSPFEEPNTSSYQKNAFTQKQNRNSPISPIFSSGSLSPPIHSDMPVDESFLSSSSNSALRRNSGKSYYSTPFSQYSVNSQMTSIHPPQDNFEYKSQIRSGYTNGMYTKSQMNYQNNHQVYNSNHMYGNKEQSRLRYNQNRGYSSNIHNRNNSSYYVKNDYRMNANQINPSYTFQYNDSRNYPMYNNSSPCVLNESPTQEIVKGTAAFNLIRRRLDEISNRKKRGENVEKLYNAICNEVPTCYLVWLEWSRYEMELGNIKKCRSIMLKGLSILPQNETLLEKRVKIEERLRNVNGVIECANIFLEMNSTRCVKNIVEAAIVVAKLGYGYQASMIFQSLIQHNLFTQGGVTLDYIRFVFKTENYQRGLDMLKQCLTKLTKHGPMWFFTFSVLEQNHTIYWKLGDIASRPYNYELEKHLEAALECLNDDLKWKVYYIAAQAQLRSFTHIRLRTRTKKRYLKAYCHHYPQVINICFQYLYKCVNLCPDDYKWKVWLLAGRVLALSGRRKSAIKCLVRSTEIAPYRSTHAVCLELARILDFIGDLKTAGEVIDRNMLLFPDEWKLVLERIQQLLRENKVKEAYHLNKDSLKYHLSAGRLWSSIIQLTHQLYGPTTALQVFYTSLQYVAKSGEVWCEGARIFMNPISKHFNPLNAQRCLNFAVYFTPQYGDSFIEAIRLSMITSNELLLFGRSNNPCFLSSIMSSRDYRAIVNKCVYSDPNYGSCWFRAKLFPLGSAEEVAFRAIKFTAHEIAINSNVYYDAMLQLAKKRLNGGNIENKRNVQNLRFSYSFEPYQMIISRKNLTVEKKLKVLFGTSQIEA